MTRPLRMIVGEVSITWVDGRRAGASQLPIAVEFERMIATNQQRGYRLHSFQLHRVMTGPIEMNETIIAVFESTS